MTSPPTYRGPRWKAWLGLFLVLPLAVLSAAVLFLVSRQLLTGELWTVAKSYGSTSRLIEFADRPVIFLLFWVFHLAFALMLVAVTVIVARLSLRRLRGS